MGMQMCRVCKRARTHRFDDTDLHLLWARYSVDSHLSFIHSAISREGSFPATVACQSRGHFVMCGTLWLISTHAHNTRLRHVYSYISVYHTHTLQLAVQSCGDELWMTWHLSVKLVWQSLKPAAFSQPLSFSLFCFHFCFCLSLSISYAPETTSVFSQEATLHHLSYI